MFLYIDLWLIFLTILSYFLVSVCYRKEEYEIRKDKIIYNYWSIFSDNSVEINLNKIVQVHTVLGFFQNAFFKTWTILIDTAWSNTSKLILKNIDTPLEFYEIIQEKMRENWYELKKDKLVQTAKPHWLWVILEVFSRVFAILFFLFIVTFSLLVEFFEEWIWWEEEYFFIMSLGIFFLLFFLVSMFIFSYLDLKRRRYDVYTDSVFYTEWFLTKNFSFLPMETIADTENRQWFFSKIMWLHDVILSSEWSNNKVIFKNMLDWEQMMKNIKYLKNSIIKKEKKEAPLLKDNLEVKEDIIWYKNKIDSPLDYNKEFKATYRISMLKLLLPLILLVPFVILSVFIPTLLPSILVIATIFIITQLIRIKFTEYTVWESNIEMRYNFLSNKYNSFSIDKITGLVIKESFIDKWIWTCSIQFWSIGSSSSITFYWIKKTKNLEKDILSKIWIRKEEKYEDIPVSFNLANFMKASIWVTIFFAILLIWSIFLTFFIPGEAIVEFFFWIVFYIILFFLLYLYKKIFYNKKRYIQRLYENFVESISWIFFVTKYYSLFRNVKWIKVKKYPFANSWVFEFDIAWEQLVQQWNNQAPQLLSNSIKISYLEGVFDLQDRVDLIISEWKLDKNLLKTSKQDVANSIVFFLILWIIISLSSFAFWDIFVIVPIILIFVVIILWVTWYIKVKFFNFEKSRVLYNYWIIYKSRHSILYSRINFIEKNEWMLNKIFKNWSVKIYTLWSWNVEMTLSDMDNYREIYDLLKKD